MLYIHNMGHFMYEDVNDISPNLFVDVFMSERNIDNYGPRKLQNTKCMLLSYHNSKPEIYNMPWISCIKLYTYWNESAFFLRFS